MQPPPTKWAIPCHEQVVELDTILPIQAPLEPGQSYRVIVNDRVTGAFSLPRPELKDTALAESPIEDVEIMVLERDPREYQLRIVSAMPQGSSCSQFNGYEIRRIESNSIERHRHPPPCRSEECHLHHRLSDSGNHRPLGIRIRAGYGIHR